MAGEDVSGKQEAIPPELAAIRERDKAVQRKILDLVASDPNFKDKLLENPNEALREAGLADEIKELLEASQGEVVGHRYWSSWCCYYSSST